MDWIKSSINVSRDIWIEFQKVARSRGLTSANLLRQLIFDAVKEDKK